MGEPATDVSAQRESFSKQRTGACWSVRNLLAASEWLTRKGRSRDSFYYVVAACFVGIVSLMLATFFGLLSLEHHALWIVYGLSSLGAFWIASAQSGSARLGRVSAPTVLAGT